MKEAGGFVYSARLASLQFWLYLFTGVGILGSLALGFTEGREYLEALWPLDLGIAATTLIFGYSIVAAKAANRHPL